MLVDDLSSQRRREFNAGVGGTGVERRGDDEFAARQRSGIAQLRTATAAQQVLADPPVTQPPDAVGVREREQEPGRIVVGERWVRAWSDSGTLRARRMI